MENPRQQQFNTLEIPVAKVDSDLVIYIPLDLYNINCTYVVISDIELIFFFYLLMNLLLIYVICADFFKIKWSFKYNVLFVNFPPYLQDRTVYPLD